MLQRQYFGGSSEQLPNPVSQSELWGKIHNAWVQDETTGVLGGVMPATYAQSRRPCPAQGAKEAVNVLLASDPR